MKDENAFIIAVIITWILLPILYILHLKCRLCKRWKRFTKGELLYIYNYKIEKYKNIFLCEQCNQLRFLNLRWFKPKYDIPLWKYLREKYHRDYKLYFE